MTFIMVNLFFIKFYDVTCFQLMTFFKITVPIMAYLVCTLFLNLIEFMKLLHIEEIEANKSRKRKKNKAQAEEEESALISPKQYKLLIRISRDLLAYFGIFYLS